MSEQISKISIQGESALPEKGSRRRRGYYLVWGGLIVFLAIIGLALYNSQRGRVAVGEKAPQFNLASFDGKSYNIPDLKGKVILINFWASWCVPCANEAGYLQTAWKSYEQRDDVLFLGVDYTDTEKSARAYLQRFGITYPNGPDLGTRISDMYRMTGVPETFIIDQNGRLADFKYGEFTSAEEIQQKIDRLLK